MSEKSTEQRLAVSETKIEDVQNELVELKRMSMETHDFVVKTNGALPRIEKSVTLIAEKFENFEKSHTGKLQEISTKVKVIWAFYATIGGAIVVSLVGYLFTKI